MKVKILSLLLSVTLFFFAAMPARASEVSTGYVNILDLCTPNNSGNLAVSLAANKTDITFSTGVTFFGYYLDVLVFISGNVPSSVSFVTASGSIVNLEILSIGDGLYRILGQLPYYSMSSFTLRFTHSAISLIEFLSFNVSTVKTKVFPELGTCQIRSQNYTATINYNPSDEINRRVFSNTDDPGYVQVVLDIQWQNWVLYDYLSFVMLFQGTAINSITALIDEQPIECQIQHISNSNYAKNQMYISCVIDLSGIDKSSSSFPTVHIEASNVPGQNCVVNMLEMCGHVNASDFNPVLHFLSRIYSSFNRLDIWIQNQTTAIVNAFKGNTSPGDSFQDQVQEEIDELDQAVDVMDSVSRPDINSIDVSMDQFVSGADLAVLTAPVGVFFEQDLFKTILIMSILFATVSFVLFGKR